MLTIQNLEVRFDVAADDDSAAFGRLFADHMRRWSQAQEIARCRRSEVERERTLGDQETPGKEVGW
jgi:hypothetical protein